MAKKLTGRNMMRDYRTFCLDRLREGQVVAYRQSYKPTAGSAYCHRRLRLMFVRSYRFFAQFRTESGRLASIQWPDVYKILVDGKYNDPLTASVLGGSV